MGAPSMLLATLVAAVCGAAAAAKPHLIYVLADDFGHYDVGFNGGEVKTPTLDALAADGVILERYYAYQFCSPTRSSFLSGRFPLHVNTENNPSDKPGGVDVRMTTIGEQLSMAGYYCSVAGKWHGGGYLQSQVPTHRGFDTALTFLNGNEDHYTQYFGILEGIDLYKNGSPAFGMNGTYGGIMYTAHHMATVHNFASTGKEALFMYMPFQNTHSPYEVPDEYLDPKITSAHSKQTMFGMIKFMDQAVLNVTTAMKSLGMWDNTLLVFSADNGGEVTAAGNNYPLRGGKYTDFEGGVNVAAFASGGLVAANARGTRTNELIHICDMWSTFSILAGMNGTVDARAAAYNALNPSNTYPVPPIDSLNVVQALTALNGSSTRSMVAISKKAIILGKYKLIYFASGGKNTNKWVPPEFPAYSNNGSVPPSEPYDQELRAYESNTGFPADLFPPLETIFIAQNALKRNRARTFKKFAKYDAALAGVVAVGRLLDLLRENNCAPIFDKSERTDLLKSGSAKAKALLTQMSALLDAVVATAWETATAAYYGNYTNCISMDEYKEKNDGFLGPLCTLCTSPPCSHPPSPPGPSPGPTPPPGKGSKIRHAASGLCLVPVGFQQKSSVTLANCSEAYAAGWSIGSNSTINSDPPNFGGEGSTLCLRPSTPPEFPNNCNTGRAVFVGKNGCMQLEQTSIISAGCPGMCLVEAAGAPVLGSCSGVPAASGWEVVSP